VIVPPAHIHQQSLQPQIPHAPRVPQTLIRLKEASSQRIVCATLAIMAPTVIVPFVRQEGTAQEAKHN